MQRALWKGAISFGLVHIPVELFSAVKQHELDLTMLDKRDFSPIGFRRYNKRTGKEVKWDDIVKGYEYKDSEYVVLSDEDLKRANVEATQTIDILAFVDAAELPLIYYEQPYYLAPDRGGDKVYALLRETLRRADKVAIAQVVIRTKQHLAALLCVGDTIVLNTLRYNDEIRPSKDLELPAKALRSAGISDKEVQMALSLVEGMTEQWDPSQYHDSYREDVLALVKKKVKARQTKTITEPEPETPKASAGNVIDLMALLKQSLGKKTPGKGSSANAGTASVEPIAKRKVAPASAKNRKTTAVKRASAAKKTPDKKTPAKRSPAPQRARA
ncbi:non-homologous end joining protein Ku [Undibacterium terreum]|uniref:Non-homologous end joining protein Ku n=1 Tax=Undibacterium terreum TaxID=1224302 RepID=A0A916XG35_9BURK|nr:Ku protein [Undibacterium terreum]GGC69563.1 non-homologous end joining protein Ku [Undibacterium terreum]